MLDQLFDAFRKAAESSLHMQQDMFKYWTPQWSVASERRRQRPANGPRTPEAGRRRCSTSSARRWTRLQVRHPADRTDRSAPPRPSRPRTTGARWRISGARSSTPSRSRPRRRSASSRSGRRSRSTWRRRRTASRRDASQSTHDVRAAVAGAVGSPVLRQRWLADMSDAMDRTMRSPAFLELIRFNL